MPTTNDPGRWARTGDAAQNPGPRRDDAAVGETAAIEETTSATNRPEQDSAQPIDVHPVCMLLPEMSDEDFAGLKADIKGRGLLRPILMHEGQVLDGRHRARACEELGIEARFEEWSGTDPVAFVLSENLHRRHLTASQKAMVAAAAMDLHTEAAQARQRAGTHAAVTLASRDAKVPEADGTLAQYCANPPSGKAAATAAAVAGVSTRSVESALKVQKEGTPADVRDVIDGKSTVNAKVREIAARKTPPAPAPAPRKPTGIEVSRHVMAVTAALAALADVDSHMTPGEPALAPMVDALERAATKYRAMLEGAEVGHA
jgi:ParB-like chromosome segregation protein Spo0J